MSSKCSTLRDIETAAQIVDSFLSTPNALTPAVITTLINQILLVEGSVQSLPINNVRKADILNRLNQAIVLLQGGTPGLTNIEIILAVSQILQTVFIKIENLCLPCPQGTVIVNPSNTFSTLCCNCCM